MLVRSLCHNSKDFYQRLWEDYVDGTIERIRRPSRVRRLDLPIPRPSIPVAIRRLLGFEGLDVPIKCYMFLDAEICLGNVRINRQKR